MMARTTHLSTLAAALTIAICLCVQPILADESSSPRIKRIYTDEDAPPEIRFHKLLTLLAVRPDESRSYGDRQLKNLGIAPEDVSTIRAYLESLYEQAQAEVDEGIWRVACQSNADSFSGLEIRVVYNSFDELRFAVAAKFLALASAELASKGYTDFLHMIKGYPGTGASFKVISTDHRYAWGEDDYEIQENRARACRAISVRRGKISN